MSDKRSYDCLRLPRPHVILFDRFESGVTAAFLARDSGALVDCERATRLDHTKVNSKSWYSLIIYSAFIAWIATTRSPVQFATGRQAQTLVKVSLPSRTLCTCRSIHKVLLCLLYSVYNATKGTLRPSVHTTASNVLWNRLGISTISVLLSIIQIFTTCVCCHVSQRKQGTSFVVQRIKHTHWRALDTFVHWWPG